MLERAAQGLSSFLNPVEPWFLTSNYYIDTDLVFAKITQESKSSDAVNLNIRTVHHLTSLNSHSELCCCVVCVLLDMLHLFTDYDLLYRTICTLLITCTVLLLSNS